MPRAIASTLTLILLAMFLAGCSQNASEPSTETDAYTVDPLFREYYGYLNGKEILGEAISPLISDQSVKCQYTTNALMVFDAHRGSGNPFYLAPLGLKLKINENPVAKPADPQAKYVGGHIVYQDFVALYEKLGDVSVVGNPITENHFIPDQKRFEQYFENLGFYRVEGDPPGVVQIMPYGEWNKASTCMTLENPSGAPALLPAVAPVFKNLVDQLGTDFTGIPLMEAYTASNGQVEQVFANVVMTTDLNNPGAVTLVSLPEKVGVLPGAVSVPGNDPSMTFVATQGDKGFDVPNHFLDYLNRHGGTSLSGLPITALSQNGQTYRQCFTKLCLIQDASQGSANSVQPEPLGYSYKKLFYQGAEPTSTIPSATLQELTLQIKVNQPKISSSQEQEIVVIVLAQSSPVKGIQPTLALTMPDGSVQTFTLPATNDEGQTSLRIPPIQAPNMTLIGFEVCIQGQTADNYCYKDSYMIWDEP